VIDSKPFDVAHYDADDSAKHVVIAYLRRIGLDAQVNEDRFGVDVVAHRGEKHYQIEVEVKHAWSEAEFPFTTLHYAARKIKFAQSAVETHFFTLNHQRTHALIVAARHLLDAPIVTKETLYTDAEQFIEVSLACARLRSLHT
jgi:hypothetical protein